MDNKEKRLVIDLMQELLDTNSPKKKEEAIKNYFEHTGLDYDPGIVVKIINSYEAKTQEKSEAGKKFIERKKEVKQKGGYGPGFKESGEFNCKCKSCDRMIAPKQARFFEKIDGKNVAYCAIGEECFPLDKKDQMKKNHAYVKWIMKMQQITLN